MTLGEYLKAPRPAWDWIQHDCSRWLDTWLTINGHPSAMKATGIEYCGPVSAQRVIERGGGLLALWDAGMSAIGLNVIDEPVIGDAAILALPTEDDVGQTCGIWTGERWASLHYHGLLFGFGTPLRIWRV